VVPVREGLSVVVPEPRLSAEDEFTAFFNGSYASLLSFAIWWGRGGRCFPAPGENLPDGVADSREFDRLEGEQWVAELLAELPPAQHAVLSRFLDGMSIREISGDLRKTEATVRQNFKLARDRLRPLVGEYHRTARKEPR
jgi:DNA-directed RNA polymerase specialized sigma24 family protein